MPKGTHFKHYTQEEDDWLRENYSRSNHAMLLSRFPNRKLNSICDHANQSLGLRKDRNALDFGYPKVDTMIGHLSEIEKAYLAGILDGEGCIALVRNNGRKNKSGYPEYYPRVSIGNTSVALQSWFEKHMPNIGIFVYHARPHDNNPMHRNLWEWTLNGNRRCMVFLSEISPYLVVKKEQAELLSQGYVTLDDKQREALYARMCILKRTC